MTRLQAPTWRRLSASALLGAVALAAGPALATDKASAPAPAAAARYQKERADCEAGRTAQDRATCLKEAGAAAEERKRKGLENTGSPQVNATERCSNVPAKDRADCLARAQDVPVAPNQRVTTTGSVAGGGVLKETTTTIPGSVVVVPAPASAPGK